MTYTRLSLLFLLTACTAAEPDLTLDTPGSQALSQPLLGEPTQFPIVLHHGFGGGHDGILAYNGVAEALRADGHTVVQTEVPPFDGIAVRVEHLRAAVDRTLAETGAAKVNIIAHSLGGLDARHLISALGYGDRVASLSTVSTPHAGTLAADFALALVPGAVDPAVDALARLLGAAINDASAQTNVRAGLKDLSVANAPTFAADHPDDPAVYYQSWAGVSSPLGLGLEQYTSKVRSACQDRMLMAPYVFDRLRPIYLAVAPIVAGNLLAPMPNDGLVSVESARYGHFRGCLPADHSEEVGRYLLGNGPNLETGFDHLRFYRALAFELTELGY